MRVKTSEKSRSPLNNGVFFICSSHTWFSEVFGSTVKNMYDGLYNGEDAKLVQTQHPFLGENVCPTVEVSDKSGLFSRTSFAMPFVFAYLFCDAF